MLKVTRRLVAAGLSIALLCPEALAQRSARTTRVRALLVANDYSSTSGVKKLPATINDGRDFAAAFGRLPFAALKSLENPSREQFEAELLTFLAEAEDEETLFFYYAGHGVQRKGTNYLLLSDGTTFVDVMSIVRVFRGRSRSVVIVLDACRNDPWDSAGSVMPETMNIAQLSVRALTAVSLPSQDLEDEGSKSAGLSKVSVSGEGVLLVFSTDPNNVAIDALPGDRNSPFAKSLVRHVQARLSFEDILTSVTKDVVSETRGRQTPWKQGSLAEPLFFAGPALLYGDGSRHTTIVP